VRLLVQTQLSNYDASGTWLLECDSGWQMCIGRVRELLKLSRDLRVTVLGPKRDRLRTQPEDVSQDVFGDVRVSYVEQRLIPNALATRYDFDMLDMARALRLDEQKVGIDEPYDVAYINDPMHLRNYMALFMLYGKRRPRFVVHSHFIDNPESPKFPADASLWYGQLEAAARADYNFWQCASALNVFLGSAQRFLTRDQLTLIRKKSEPWDDGYSASEIRAPFDERNIRFDLGKLRAAHDSSVVLFVPNRVGVKGRSSDYTNCGRFLFEILPTIRASLVSASPNITIIAGNPSQKISNAELAASCGTMTLVPDALNRDELKAVMSLSHIAVGLYDQDSYGGTASREAIELGCVPLWIRNYEYSRLALASGFSRLARPDFSDMTDFAVSLIRSVAARDEALRLERERLARIVREQCSYEATTSRAAERLFGHAL